MSKEPMTEEVKSLNKKLIPANIIIAVVALVAAICTMVMPWFDLRIKVDSKKLAEVIELSSSENPSEGTESEGSVDIAKLLQEALMKDGVIPDVPVNIYPMKLLGAATGSTEEMSAFIISSIGADGVAAFAKDFIDDILPLFLTKTVEVVLDTAIKESITESGVELTPEQEAKIEEYKGEATTIVSTLVGDSETESNPVKAKEKFSNLVDEIVSEEFGGEIEIDKEAISNAFDIIVDAGTKDGKFEVTTLIENIDVIQAELEKIFGDFGEDINPDDYIPDDFNPDEFNPEDFLPSAEAEKKPITLLSASQEEAAPPENGAESEAGTLPAELQQILDFLNDPEGELTKILNNSGVNFEQIKPIILVVWILFIGLPALFWFALAIKAFIRIFTDKKSFHMIGAKFFGFFAAFFIIVLNFAIVPIVNSVGGDAAQIFEFISFKFLGSGIVVAICWLALVLMTWFYYNPIKRKIKHALDNPKPVTVGAPAADAPVAEISAENNSTSAGETVEETIEIEAEAESTKEEENNSEA